LIVLLLVIGSAAEDCLQRLMIGSAAAGKFKIMDEI